MHALPQYETLLFILEIMVMNHMYNNIEMLGSCHKRQKPQAPMPQAPIRNRQTRKVANAKGLNRNTNLTLPNLT